MSKPSTAPARVIEPLARLHFQLGWWTVLTFLLLGLALETMHGFKVELYLNVANETRRLMWTLAHAHGALVGVLHLGLAATLQTFHDWADGSRQLASRCLIAATFLLPGGFFLGGMFIHSGDPGLGILLVPVGALLLLLAAFLTARAAGRPTSRS